MNKYNEIKRNAERTGKVSGQVVDNFLIYYAASRDRLDKLFERKVKRFRHMFTKMPKEWKGFLKTGFIAHEIFKPAGLIHKYLKHAEVGFRSNRELEYLKLQKDHPWQYSFSKILDNPHPDFYTMHDIFTGREYLLYSRGISDILQQTPDIRTWFNLIGFDGMCMQTYGTIAYFRSFERHDIAFFSRELDYNLENDIDIAEHIEKKSHTILYALVRSHAARYNA